MLNLNETPEIQQILRLCILILGGAAVITAALSAEDMEIGGLGIYMVKKTMDGISYKYIDGQNILSIMKRL